MNPPAQYRAEYSPRLSPAAQSGTMPSSASTAVTPAAKATMQGWVYSVSFSTPSGSRNMAAFRSNPSPAPDLSTTARKAGKASYRSAPMPGCWVPCPA